MSKESATPDFRHSSKIIKPSHFAEIAYRMKFCSQKMAILIPNSVQMFVATILVAVHLKTVNIQKKLLQIF